MSCDACPARVSAGEVDVDAAPLAHGVAEARYPGRRRGRFDVNSTQTVSGITSAIASATAKLPLTGLSWRATPSQADEDPDACPGVTGFVRSLEQLALVAVAVGAAMRCLIWCACCAYWPGVRRAGRSTAEPGADAGQAPRSGAALI